MEWNEMELRNEVLRSGTEQNGMEQSETAYNGLKQAETKVE